MYTQNVSIPPDYFGHWRSTDGSHIWHGDTGNIQEKTGMF